MAPTVQIATAGIKGARRRRSGSSGADLAQLARPVGEVVARGALDLQRHHGGVAELAHSI